MKAQHVFGGHIYLISNYGVARNPIFKDVEDLNFFKDRFDHYLGEICDVLASSHQINQFQYLVKIKERNRLEEFYVKKKALKKTNVSHDIYNPKADEIPESYLIFSQEVSNCLNSVAKKFNFRHNRRGGLFAGRYSKVLVESESEMNEWISRLSGLETLVNFDEEWCAEELKEARNKELETSNVAGDYVLNLDLRGCFMCLPPKSTKLPFFNRKFENYFENHGKNPPW